MVPHPQDLGRKLCVAIKMVRKCVNLSYKEIAKKDVKCPSPSKGNQKKSTRPKASTESEDKFLSYKQSLIVVIVSKPQLQLTGQVAATEPLLRFQNTKKRFKEVYLSYETLPMD